MEFVRESSLRELGILPEVISAQRTTRRAPSGATRPRWAASRFERARAAHPQTLDEVSGSASSSPIPSASATRSRGATAVARDGRFAGRGHRGRRDDRASDCDLKDDIARGFELRMTAVEKVLLEMEARGQQVPGRHAARGRVFDLVNRSRVRRNSKSAWSPMLRPYRSARR